MQGVIGSRSKLKKKGQDRNPAPFLNPISYEKPNRVRQGMCRKSGWEAGKLKEFLLR
jgi:hypothetical protein